MQAKHGPRRYNFLYSSQGRPCGRPPAALRPGNDSTVTGELPHPRVTEDGRYRLDHAIIVDLPTPRTGKEVGVDVKWTVRQGQSAMETTGDADRTSSFGRSAGGLNIVL